MWRLAKVPEQSPQADPQPSRRLVYGEDERVGRWIASRTDGEWRPGAKCIGLERNGELIAGAAYDLYNGASAHAHIASSGSHWMTRDFLWHIFHYPFEQLGCEVLIGTVPAADAEVLNFDKHLGFVELARIPKGHPTGALAILTITKEQARRWLELKEAA